MTGTDRICIAAGRVGGLESEAADRIRALGLQAQLVDAADASTALAGATALVSLYPADRAAHLCIGLALGMGLPVLILSSAEDAAAVPRGARLFTTLQALVDAVPVGGEGRHIGEPLLQRLGACEDGLAWYRRRYPDGGSSCAWTPEEQAAALRDGGGPWLKTAFDHGLLPHHPMAGFDFTEARLPGVLLTASNLREARLAKADLSDSQLTFGDLTRADLSGAILDRTVFRRCDLVEAKAQGVVGESVGFERCRLDGLDAPEARLDGARLRGTSAKAAKLPRASLRGCTHEKVDFTAADFTSASLAGSHFIDCRCPGATFRDADLADVLFVRCVFDGADFTNTDRSKTHFQP